jgi:tungstate transport system ATP-binding protein
MTSTLPLTFENVTYRVGDKAIVSGLTFALAAGPRTVILGPNGAGKSVSLRLCHGLLQPSSGRIAANGGTPDAARRRQAMVFQRPVLLRRSTLGNVSYALALRGFGWRERRRRAEAALDRVGLADLAVRPARVLSAGEQQRLALARAWATEPEILFLDEPTANLDPAATRLIEAAIGAIHAAGTKIVMTTHDLGQARRIADDVMFLHRGRLVERTPAERFFDRPRTTEAATFLKGDLTW